MEKTTTDTFLAELERQKAAFEQEQKEAMEQSMLFRKNAEDASKRVAALNVAIETYIAAQRESMPSKRRRDASSGEEQKRRKRLGDAKRKIFECLMKSTIPLDYDGLYAGTGLDQKLVRETARRAVQDGDIQRDAAGFHTLTDRGAQLLQDVTSRKGAELVTAYSLLD